METEFSESSYAFAATREIETLLRRFGQTLIHPPYIPTLREEKDIGFDVWLDTSSIAIVLQFKTGEFVSRAHSLSTTWPLAGGQHYRTQFSAGHHQIQRLQELEAAFAVQGAPAIVRYMAPEFWEGEQFSKHYFAGEIVRKSYGCAPSAVPADRLEHHLIRVPADGTLARRTFVMSEPFEIENEDIAETLEVLIKDRPTDGHQRPELA